MQIGERAVFRIQPQLAYGEKGSGKIGPNETIYFEAELLEIESETKLDYQPEERVQKAQEWKKQANQLFKEKKYKKAKKLYDKALDYIDWETLPGVIQLKVKLQNNLALLCMKQNLHEEALTYCNKAIELNEKGPKSLFLKGKILRILQDFDQSKRLLKQALKYQPGNEQIKREMDLLEKDVSKYRETKKKMFDGLFG